MGLYPGAFIAAALPDRLFEFVEHGVWRVVNGMGGFDDDVNIAAIRILLWAYEGLLGLGSREVSVDVSIFVAVACSKMFSEIAMKPACFVDCGLARVDVLQE